MEAGDLNSTLVTLAKGHMEGVITAGTVCRRERLHGKIKATVTEEGDRRILQ